MRLEPQATIVRGAGAATSYRARPARARAFDGRSRACGVERPRRTGRAGACGWTWTFSVLGIFEEEASDAEDLGYEFFGI